VFERRLRRLTDATGPLLAVFAENLAAIGDGTDDALPSLSRIAAEMGTVLVVGVGASHSARGVDRLLSLSGPTSSISVKQKGKSEVIVEFQQRGKGFSCKATIPAWTHSAYRAEGRGSTD
jgi:hypothetical protein